MITSTQDYIAYLYRLQNPNRQLETICLPPDEPLYEIDLNTRRITAPEFLSVEYDHNAETVYFCVDRYYDNTDLSELFAVVQYENADPIKERRGYIYPVPYFDVSGPDVPPQRMLFPWVIQGPATEFAGTVTFSVKFYRISDTTVDNEDGTSRSVKVYDYVLNTQPVTSKVLHGLNIHAHSENYIYPEQTIEDIYQRIAEIERTDILYWTVLTPLTPNTHINPAVDGITDKSEDIYNIL